MIKRIFMLLIVDGIFIPAFALEPHSMQKEVIFDAYKNSTKIIQDNLPSPLPMEVSYVGLVITVVLTIWMFMASRDHR